MSAVLTAVLCLAFWANAALAAESKVTREDVRGAAQKTVKYYQDTYQKKAV